uniref:CSON000688 protein n=1 Tax=Culicoides sonorensis TaxID=179676 RepID=A0A336M2G8_CULSO
MFDSIIILTSSSLSFESLSRKAKSPDSIFFVKFCFSSADSISLSSDDELETHNHVASLDSGTRVPTFFSIRIGFSRKDDRVVSCINSEKFGIVPSILKLESFSTAALIESTTSFACCAPLFTHLKSNSWLVKVMPPKTLMSTRIFQTFSSDNIHKDSKSTHLEFLKALSNILLICKLSSDTRFES